MDLETLLSFGLFAKELPPPFTSKRFADFIVANRPAVKPRSGKQLITRACNYNLARPGNLRRTLQIPHPFNYYQLCSLLTDNWASIAAHINKANLSASKPAVDQRKIRAVRPEREGSELPILRARNRANAKAILRTDITRFFHSIYTHSIPWAMDGRAAAKKERSKGTANHIDLFLRNGQDAQTLGIPVGPDTSLIVAEIVGAAVDEQLEVAGFRGFRFVDDYEFAFSSRTEAEAAIPRIERILREFELALNPQKTYVDDLPQALERKWVSDLREFRIERSLDTSTVIYYFDKVFELHHEHPGEAVLSYGIARLGSEDIDLDAWPVFQDLLFQCVMAEPGSLQSVVTLFHQRGDREISDGFANVLADVITFHAPLGHSSEVAWALWAALWFDIMISKSAASVLIETFDNVSALLTLHARSKGLLMGKPSFAAWKDLMTEESIYDGNWLLVYEADLKGWLTAKGKSPIDTDPNLRLLKRNGVSFYDPDIEVPTAKALFLGAYGEVMIAAEDEDWEGPPDKDEDEDWHGPPKVDEDDLPF